MTESATSARFDFAWIRSTLPGATVRVPPTPPTAFIRLGTDSRSVTPGELFVALSGDNFDGHRFVEGAVAAGATGVLVRRGALSSEVSAALLKHSAVIEVEDTLVAYREIAAHWRSKFSIPVIGIAGSVGKTTTKELVAALVSHLGPVLKTEGSENGFVGIPKTLLRLSGTDRVAVIEIGIDDIGAMAQHLELVQPTHGVVTVIAEEHLEKLRDLPTVLEEEKRLLDWLTEHHGSAIFNADDRHLEGIAKGGAWSNAVRYSLDTDDRTPHSVTGKVLSDEELEIHFPDSTKTRLRSPLPGNHNLSNLLGASAVAWAVGVPAKDLPKALEQFTPPKGRSVMQSHPDGMDFILDYYNANPSSVRAALELLHRRSLQESKRSRACLADMLELGNQEEALHRGLAVHLIRHGIDRVWLLGPRMQWLHDELLVREFSGELRYFEDAELMREAFVASLPIEEVILIKGSRGMRMERLVADLNLTNKGQA